MKVNLYDFTYKALEEFIISMGEPKFRAKQIMNWLYSWKTKDGRYQDGIERVEQMTNLPMTLREKLNEQAELNLLIPLKVQESKIDGTKKFLFELSDGNAIESVFMEYKYGNSLCISSQAGCRMGCKFCASTIGGLRRNLSAGEMVSQVLSAQKYTKKLINHIVVMGTGEPFDNYENLADFLRIINEPQGLNLGMRNITVSTCGIVPKIKQFAMEFPQVNLAISLHGTCNEMRSGIMPINQVYPMEILHDACLEYTRLTSRRITFEYTLVKGVNDRPEHAEALSKWIGKMLCHVNLIPLNKVEETGFETTGKQEAHRFQQLLEKRGIPTTIRRELGDDIDGACGQLRLGETVAK